jgi:hypothetical protein
MSDGVIIALIAIIPTSLAAVASIFGVKNHQKSTEIGETLVQVKLNLNHRLDQLLEANKAQGRLDEQGDMKRDAAAEKCKYDTEGVCKYPGPGA